MEVKAKIRKYKGGGLGALNDPGIPQVEVEVYLRSSDGETFYVPTLQEGITHLLSDKGYRLTVNTWPQGAGIDKPCYGLKIYRQGQNLSVNITAPGMAFVDPATDDLVADNKVVWDDHKTPLEQPIFADAPPIEHIDLGEALGLPKPSLEELYVEEEVNVGHEALVNPVRWEPPEMPPSDEDGE